MSDSRILDGEIMGSRLDDVRAYDGVRTKRVMAFIIDYILIGILIIPVAILIGLLGLLTLGLGWTLFGIIGPLVALLYVATTLGGRHQATVGMRMMGIHVERLDGRPVDGLTAIIHTVLFWAGNAILTPFILLATFFLDRKRLLHDLLLGTVVIRDDF